MPSILGANSVTGDFITNSLTYELTDTPALETLYTYTEQEDGSFTRPLGELPTL